MTNLYESNNYDLSFRGILSNNDFKLYTNNDSITISSDISFDINADYKSSINYFSASILGGIAHTIIKESKHSDIEIEELEGKIHLVLKNPLTLLNVKGYDEEPKIENCSITYYLYADIEEEQLIEFCNKALRKSFIYNTLKNVINFDIKFILID
ncbi:OsmC family protein [uncultured Gemella sp.]|uniref:OsmC family protein n=1 Tax=uncultured Gemella sp. TaxID=254352 RepID=UPI0028D749F7|nr:OsmC family protein [uncultured Gemella sp.]